MVLKMQVWTLGFCVSNELPRDADAAGSQTCCEWQEYRESACARKLKVLPCIVKIALCVLSLGLATCYGKQLL